MSSGSAHLALYTSEFSNKPLLLFFHMSFPQTIITTLPQIFINWAFTLDPHVGMGGLKWDSSSVLIGSLCNFESLFTGVLNYFLCMGNLDPVLDFSP